MIMTNFAVLFFCLMISLFLVPSSRAAERLCDVSFEDCRAPLLALINNETVAIDTAFWFSDDPRSPNALIKAQQRGVKVRILMDTRSEDAHPSNTTILQTLVNAGIPMRERVATGILHWKMVMCASQGTVEFSGANFTGSELVPVTPYVNYSDEAIYFSDDPAVVNSFKSKYDDWWTDAVSYRDYNPNPMVPPPTRSWGPAITLNPELNFPPSTIAAHNYGARVISAINAEKVKLDIDMFRITNAPEADAVIKAFNRGVAVRILVDTQEYKNPNRVWDRYNVDRLFMAGIPIKTTLHQGQNHEKAVLFYGQPGTRPRMAVFGSSNWSQQSANSQQEHNYFSNTKPWFFNWFLNQFQRRWNSPSEYTPFVPIGPGAPVLKKPTNAAVAQPLSLTLTWDGGPWGQRYDVYFGISSNPPLMASDVITGAPQGPSDRLILETYKVSNLAPGKKYYWKIVGKTMAKLSANSPTWSFTTATPTLPGAGATVSAISPNTGPIAGMNRVRNFAQATRNVTQTNNSTYYRIEQFSINGSGVSGKVHKTLQ